MTVVTAPTLRPLGIGQLLDQAIRLYRRNFIKFIGIIAIVQIPITLIQMGFNLLSNLGVASRMQHVHTSPPMLPASYYVGMLGNLVVVFASLILVSGVATAALTRAVTDQYLGEPVGILDAYRRVGRAWRPLVAALLLNMLISMALVLWLLVPCAGWLTGSGILAFYAFAVTPLIAPTVVLEEQRGINAIRRAWDLTRRRFWWVVGFVLILFLFGQLVISGPVALINMGIQFVTGRLMQTGEYTTALTIQTVVQSLTSLFFSLLYLPLQLTAMTLMYFDLRIRTEGFDLTLSAESMTAGEISMAEIVARAPGPDPKSLVTWEEMGYFALLSIAAAALYFVIYVIVLGIMLALGSGGLPRF